MKVLVTGGCGFLGRNIILHLLMCGHRVRCMDVVHLPFVDELGIEFVLGDITAEKMVNMAVDGMDAIVHLACNVVPKTSNMNPLCDVETNLCGTLRLLDAATKYQVKRFVFLSSGGTVYGVPKYVPISEDHQTYPNCSYGITKLAIENYLRLYTRESGLSTCSLRLSNPYGAFQRVQSAQGAVAVFCYKVLKNETIDIWGDGTVVRDFIYIQDVVEAIENALLKNEALGEINVGSGSGTSINDLLNTIEIVTNKKTNRNYLPSRNFDVPVNVLDVTKAKNLLGWSPKTSLLDGMRETVQWIHTYCC